MRPARRIFRLVALVAVFLQAVSGFELNISPQDLPDSWTWQNASGYDYLTRIQSEHAPKYCRSSYALATAAATSSRIKIKRGRYYSNPATVLSTQVLLNCAKGRSCEGGHPEDILKYMMKVGVPDETCMNYAGKQGECNPEGICRNCARGDDQLGIKSYCWPVETYKTYRIENYGKLIRSELAQKTSDMTDKMKLEIISHGPITCEMHTDGSFVDYSGEILHGSIPDSSIEVHYVNVVGWKKADGVEYWIIRNCWGDAWGERGFARLVMGQNAFGIENACYWGILDHTFDKTTVKRNVWKHNGSHKSGAVNGTAVGTFDGGIVRQNADVVHRQSAAAVAMTSVPSSYDIRNIKGKSYASIDLDQHIPQYCGSCWAFSTISTLTDRLALAKGDMPSHYDFSTQALINCMDPNANLCGGAWHYDAYHFLEVTGGVPHQSCAPYLASNDTCTQMGRKNNVCKSYGPSGSEEDIPADEFLQLSVEDYGTITGQEYMKREIAAGGPITCTMCLTRAFANYSGGIFVDETCCNDTGHAIEVAGWGIEKGLEYWIVRNSWGTYWGEKGWGRIQMGDCDMGLHLHNCSWGIPKILL